MTNKSALKELKSATTLSDVARLLGYKPRSLSYLVYKKSDEEKYKTFQIAKKSGGTRTISSPISELQLLQQRLNGLLLDCLDEIDALNGFRTNTSHGFERKRSIITNALEHRNRKHVFNVDLEDFFGSIHYGRVIGLLTKDRNFALDVGVAKVLAGIACTERGLPQGSPCSPVFANLVARVLDSRLRTLASANRCTYTRYADDITFSTNLNIFPSGIASIGEGNAHEWVPGEELSAKIAHCGFRINKTKTRMQYRDSRQVVTGLIVNRKVNVPTEYRKAVRAMVHSLVTKGSFINKNVAGADERNVGSLDQLQGMLAYINRVDSYTQLRVKDSAQLEPITSEAMYRRFLIYKWFYITPLPIIVCDGITDNIYLQHAIRSRANQFPTLVSLGADNKVKLQLRFFRYPKAAERQTTSTGRILGLTGGASNLGNLLLSFRDTISKFHLFKKKNPVILLLDNDDGASPVFSIMKQITGVPQNSDEEFVHVVGNLYVVATQRLNKKPSKIEDFFRTIDKKILENRRFNDSSEPDPATEYGKVEFATRVVRPHASTIDFSGFDSLLTTIAKVIQHRANFITAEV